jgi:hypothetical protein
MDSYLRTSNEDYPSTKTNKTRRMIAVGSLGDDLACAAPWDILFTEGFEACMDDKGCRAFAKIFITLIIMMVVCIGGYCLLEAIIILLVDTVDKEPPHRQCMLLKWVHE